MQSYSLQLTDRVLLVIESFFLFLVGLGFHACKAGALPLELHQLFWRWGLMNCLPGLPLNHESPDLNLPSS
jgi:hypothetical protein